MTLVDFLREQNPDQWVVELTIMGISDDTMRIIRDRAFAEADLITRNDTEGFGPTDGYDQQELEISFSSPSFTTPVLIEVRGELIWVYMEYPSASQDVHPDGGDLVADIAIAYSSSTAFELAYLARTELYEQTVRSPENMERWIEAFCGRARVEVTISCRGDHTQAGALVPVRVHF